jgi:hypothetical protein
MISTSTRFAPSPTGRLHLGHAYSAMVAHDFARARNGAFRLRIEDIDPGRCREDFVENIWYASRSACRSMPKRSTGCAGRDCSIPASAPGATSRPAHRRRTGRKARAIPARAGR